MGLAIIVSLSHFIPNDIAIVAILSGFGYILSSIDPFFIIESLRKKRNKRKVSLETNSSSSHDKISQSSLDYEKISSGSTETIINDFPFSVVEWIYHIIMLILSIAVPVIIYSIFSASFGNQKRINQLDIEIILLYICIGLFVLSKILADLQRVYIFFGLIRNPFYPKNCISSTISNKKQLSINQNRKFFAFIKYLRLFILRFVGPLVLSAVISIDCYINGVYNHSFGYWRTIIILRAFRWVT